MDSQGKTRLIQEGFDCFNSGQFYEAHEHCEEVWLEAPHPEKLFLQGLIQVAAAFHHYSRDNRMGTKNLLDAGLLKLEHCPEDQWGLNIATLRSEVSRWRQALEAGEELDCASIPKIKVRNFSLRPE